MGFSQEETCPHRQTLERQDVRVAFSWSRDDVLVSGLGLEVAGGLEDLQSVNCVGAGDPRTAGIGSRGPCKAGGKLFILRTLPGRTGRHRQNLAGEVGRNRSVRRIALGCRGRSNYGSDRSRHPVRCLSG